jgi:hypothetical protein
MDLAEALQSASQNHLQQSKDTIATMERDVVILRSKLASASAASCLSQSSRPQHLQQLQVSRSAELSAIRRAEQAEADLATAQLENRLLKEQLEKRAEQFREGSMRAESGAIFQKARESKAIEKSESVILKEQNEELAKKIQLEVSEKNALAVEVQSLKAALKQQVAMMLKRNVTGINRC